MTDRYLIEYACQADADVLTPAIVRRGLEIVPNQDIASIRRFDEQFLFGTLSGNAFGTAGRVQ